MLSKFKKKKKATNNYKCSTAKEGTNLNPPVLRASPKTLIFALLRAADKGNCGVSPPPRVPLRLEVEPWLWGELGWGTREEPGGCKSP